MDCFHDSKFTSREVARDSTIETINPAQTVTLLPS